MKIVLLLEFILISSNSLSKIEIDGSHILSQNLLEEKVTSRYIGQKVSKRSIESLIGDLLHFYEQHGLPLAKIYLKKIETYRDSSTLFLQIDEGPIVVVKDIEFLGLKRTREKVLKGFFASILGKPFDGIYLDKKVTILEKEGAVKIDSFSFKKTEGGYALILFIGEEAKNSFGGVLSTTSRHQPMGEIRLNANNLWGTLRSLKLSWKRVSLRQQELSFTYREPWLFAFKLSGEVNGIYIFRESLYRKEEVSFLLGKRSGSFEYDVGIKRYDDIDFNENYGDKGNLALFRVKFSNTYQDIQVGSSLSADLKRDEFKYTLIGSLLWGLDPFCFGVKTHIDRLSSKHLRRYNLFPIGGAKTLRGFPDGHFLSVTDYIGRIELSSILKSGIFLFTEGAKIKTSVKIEKPIDYGIGVRGNSLIGKIEITFAFVRGLPFEDALVTVDVEKSF